MKKSYKQLEVWQLSIDIVNDIYNVVKDRMEELGHETKFQILPQLFSTAEHIPSSLAQTKDIKTYKKLLSHLCIANSVSIELTVKLELAKHLKEMDANNVERILQKIEQLQKLLDLMIKSVKKQVSIISDFTLHDNV